VQQIANKAWSRTAGRSPVVAIVDDDWAVCGSLKFSLELDGFTVRTFAGADELLHAGGINAYDCFVIDQKMPGMNGMELIAKLRDLKVRTPAILLVSQLNPAGRARAAQAEIPIVEKPLFGDVLVDKLRETCGRLR
jgi:two-component system, LuxR family, response regulator FixJ